MMAEESGAGGHGAGYNLVNHYAIERSFKRVIENQEELPEGEPELHFLWDWRIPNVEAVIEEISEDGKLPSFYFEIALGIEMAASEERPETGRTTLIGQFSYDADHHSVPLLQFVQLHGVAALYPYLREAVSELTDLSYHGPYYLPVADITRLMEGFELEPTTGWEQLAQHPKLANGLEVEIASVSKEETTTDNGA